MNILVIGGNRYFGKRTVARLLSAGHNVTLLNRQTQNDGFGHSVARIKCDRHDAAALEAAVLGKKWDLIYDQVCFEAQDARAACQIFKNQTPRYIFASSQSVYEPGRDLPEASFDATAYTFSQDISSSDDYAEAKRLCEAAFFAQKSFEVTAVRLPLVLGPDDYTHRLKWHVDRIKQGQPLFFSNPLAKLSSIHSNDSGLILSALATRPLSGALNVCAVTPVKMSRMIEVIEDVLGKKAQLVNHLDGSNQSPLDFGDDWFMSADKLSAMGLEAASIESWLPDLVRQLA